MEENSLVVFKGTGDGITVLLDENEPFDEVLMHFEKKLCDSQNFFKGSKLSIRFKGRSLTLEQQQQLLGALKDQQITNVSFIQEEEKRLRPSICAQPINKTRMAYPTHVHYGIVRSGHHIDFKGNVVVLGDVNPGGLITAGGHIIILGALKGKVHAGLNESIPSPFIVAYTMAPIQIGIRNIIAQSPDGDALYHDLDKVLQIAYKHEDQIYVDQIDSKTLAHMLE